MNTFINKVKLHPECGMAISRPYNEYRLFKSEEVYKFHYLTGNTMLNLALVRVFFNRERFLELGGFSPQYQSGDDYARLLMAANFPVLIVEDGLVWWRKTAGSASEKLFKSYNGAYEPLVIKYYFLNTTSLLNKEEKNLALKRLNISFFKILKSLIKNGRLIWMLKLLVNYKIIKRLGKVRT